MGLEFLNIIYWIIRMSDPATITNLLTSTLIGNTDTIKQAQTALEAIHSDPNFLPHLLLIPQEHSIPYNVQKAAAIYTLTYAKSCFLARDQQRTNSLAEGLLGFLSVDSVPLGLRRHVAVSLQYVLTKDREFTIRSMLTAHYLQLLQAASADSASVKFQFLGMMAQILIGSAENISKEIFVFIRESFPIILAFSTRLFNYAAQLLQKEDNREAILSCLRIIKIYSVVFKLYLKKIFFADMQTIKLLFGEDITQVLSQSFALTFPHNEISTTIIYFRRNQDMELVEQLHSIKADYMAGLGTLKRTLLQNFKEPKMLASNSIMQSPVLIPSLIGSVSELLSKLPYNCIKSQSLVKLVEEILQVLIISVRNNYFYKLFLDNKQAILHGCIFHILEFSDSDYESMVYEPDEFINQVLQIIDLDSTGFVKSRQHDHQIQEDPSPDDEVESYSTLRTVAATLLESFCSSIDGSLAQIFNYALAVLQGQVQSQFRTSLLMMLIGILRVPACKREGLVKEVCTVCTKIIGKAKLPGGLKQPEDASGDFKQENIMYLMILLTLFKYLPNLKSNCDEEILPVIFELICGLLNQEETPEAMKSICYDLVTVVSSMSVSEATAKFQFGLKFVEILNHLLGSSFRNLEKVLDTLFDLFKIDSLCEEMKAQGSGMVVGTVQNLVQVIYKEMCKESLLNQLFINKAWNIITDITENDIFIPDLIPEIEVLINPLLPFIDEKFELDYEENILMMMSSFIKRAQAVTQNQLNMFDIIPRLFYNQFDHMFIFSFETLQIFMFYGSNILSAAPQAMQTIIDMGVASMNTIQGKTRRHNEAENCEGVLIIQSLILSCGNSFTYEMWMGIIKAVTRRLEEPTVKNDILKSNLLATLLLVVMIGSKFLTPEENDLLLNRVLQNYNCFTVQYSSKVAIVSLAEIFSQCHQPYVINRFTYLLDTILVLLENYEKKDDLFGTSEITEEEKDYSNSLETIKNSIKEMNEIEHVKSKLVEVKQKNPQGLQAAVMQLTSKRKDTLNSLMSMTKVQNEARKIFKIRQA